MKKKIYSLLLSLFVAFSMVAADSYMFGYCDYGLARGEIQSLGAGKATTFWSFIKMPAESATLLAGNKITHVHFSLGYASCTTAKVIITEDVKGEPLYTETGAVKMLSWNDIQLTTPYTIEAGKEIYIGIEQNAIYFFDKPIDLVKDAAQATTNGDLLGFGSSAETANWSHTTENGYGNLCLLAQIEGDNLPMNDVAVSKLSLSNKFNYVRTSDNFGFVCKFKNTGLANLKSFDVTYQLDDNEPVTVSQTCEVATGNFGECEISGLKVAAEGDHKLKVTLSNPNGEADVDPSNNEMEYSFVSYDVVADRTTLLETYTMVSCQECPPGAEAVKFGLDNHKDNVLCVAHHIGVFGSDMYTVAGDDDNTFFYNSENLSNPVMMVDRTNINHLTIATDISPLVYPYYNRVNDYIDYALSQPSFVEISQNNSFIPSSREFSVEVNAKKLKDLGDGKDVRVNVYLTEDSIVGPQTGATGLYVHNHVLRQVLCDDAFGESVTWNGDEFSKTYTCTIPEAYKVDNMKVIAYISYFDSNDPNACQILNSCGSKIDSNSAITNIANDEAHGDITIYSVDGRFVKKVAEGESVGCLPRGVYVVKQSGKAEKVMF